MVDVYLASMFSELEVVFPIAFRFVQITNWTSYCSCLQDKSTYMLIYHSLRKLIQVLNITKNTAHQLLLLTQVLIKINKCTRTMTTYH